MSQESIGPSGRRQQHVAKSVFRGKKAGNLGKLPTPAPYCSDIEPKACQKSPGEEAQTGPDETRQTVEYRLNRYERAKRLSLGLAAHAMAKGGRLGERGRKQSECANLLVFRSVLSGEQRGRSVLYQGFFCQQKTTCPFCAIRRGAKFLAAYHPKVLQALNDNKNLRVYLGVLTISTGEDVCERLDALETILKRLSQVIRNARRRKEPSEFGRIAGGILSTEIKRGEGGGWHCHVHTVFLVPGRLDFAKAQAEWAKLAQGEGHRVHFKMLREDFLREKGLISDEDYRTGLVKGLCEVLKYPVKFEIGAPADTWLAGEAAGSRRLLRSFGVLRGVEVNEDCRDLNRIDWQACQWLERYFDYTGLGYLEGMRRTGGVDVMIST